MEKIVRWGLGLFLAGLLVVGASVYVPRALAASLVVDTLLDTDDGGDGFCSLREAILAANQDGDYNECTGSGYGADTITFSVSGTILLDAQLPEVTDADGLTIDGTGQAVVVSGQDTVRVLEVDENALLTLERLSIVDGFHADYAGGIFNEGTLFVNNSTLTGNASWNGGAILNGGSATVTNSYIAGNSALKAGFDGFGGGIINGGVLVVANSTLYDNAADYGGAIYNNPYGLVYVTNSTLVGNQATTAGGIANNGFNAELETIVTLKNSILANISEAECAGIGLVVAGSDNMATDDTCDNATVKTLAELNLDSPANNGGPTLTIALLPGSDAIGAANTTYCGQAVGAPDYGAGNHDQRGLFRLANGLCDVGAYEADGTTATNVAGLKAKVNGADKLVVKWRTLTESQIGGFYVWRKTKDGVWKQQNADLMQAKYAGAVQGAKYRFVDGKAKVGKVYRYKVEVVYLDGHREWTGVVRVKR